MIPTTLPMRQRPPLSAVSWARFGFCPSWHLGGYTGQEIGRPDLWGRLPQ